jgi:hypothetical protein
VTPFYWLQVAYAVAFVTIVPVWLLEEEFPMSQSSPETEGPPLQQARTAIMAASIGSCDCNTKSPNVAYHLAYCRYAKLMFALDCLDGLAQSQQEPDYKSCFFDTLKMLHEALDVIEDIDSECLLPPQLQDLVDVALAPRRGQPAALTDTSTNRPIHCCATEDEVCHSPACACAVAQSSTDYRPEFVKEILAADAAPPEGTIKDISELDCSPNQKD